MTFQTKISEALPEKKTARLTAVFKDETGTAIAAASLNTLKLTLYELSSGTIINNRNADNILNAGGGTVDSNGNLVLLLAVNDMAIVDATKIVETHVALIEWTYASGAKAGAHEIVFDVVNLSKVM